ncbi:MAG: hypothetical protein ACI9WU_000523 [Myxococcota bacterium]|jgi:hypothetical protein
MRNLLILLSVASLAGSGCSSDDSSGSSSDGSTSSTSDDTTGSDATGGDTSGGDTTGGDTTGGDTTGGDTTGGDTTGGDTGTTGVADCPENTGQRPPAISEHFGVFDPVKERVIFHGGNPAFPVECFGKNAYESTTWAYWPRCGVWEQVATAGEGPGPRGRATAIYDEGHHAMVIFGGRFRATGADGTSPYTMYGDTWWLDLSTDTWSKVETKGTAPSPRILSSAIYDPEGERMLLFGGSTANTGLNFFPQNDVWELDLGNDTWTQLAVNGAAPTARQYHGAIYDPIAHALVVTGGGDANAFFGPFFGDTWSLDLGTMAWTQLHAGTQAAPDRRIWGRTVYAPGLDRMVLFGGHDDGSLGNRNDMWMFDLRNKQWELVGLGDTINNVVAAGQCDLPADFATIEEGTPERRSAHLFVYWPAEGSLLIHGGKTDCGLIDDVWQLDVQSYEWTNHEPASIGEACERYSETCQGHCG